MKSRNDFLTLTEYEFYLQTYYAGIALGQYIQMWDNKNSQDIIIQYSVKMALLITDNITKDIKEV